MVFSGCRTHRGWCSAVQKRFFGEFAEVGCLYLLQDIAWNSIRSEGVRNFSRGKLSQLK